jgi:hypothetical protein
MAAQHHCINDRLHKGFVRQRKTEAASMRPPANSSSQYNHLGDPILALQGMQTRPRSPNPQNPVLTYKETHHQKRHIDNENHPLLREQSSVGEAMENRFQTFKKLCRSLFYITYFFYKLTMNFSCFKLAGKFAKIKGFCASLSYILKWHNKRQKRRNHGFLCFFTCRLSAHTVKACHVLTALL